MTNILTENPKKVWWFAWEINGSMLTNGKRLSHRACARATDLVAKSEAESRRIGRFKVYRFKFEELPE